MKEILTNLLGSQCDGPVFVHSDIRSLVADMNIDFREYLSKSNGEQLITEHFVEILQGIVDDRDIWIPAYNYDFSQTGRFDVDQDQSQIGMLPENFRKFIAEWRTATPVFSTCGLGQKPRIKFDKEVFDPFGKEAECEELFQRNGILLFFGVKFSPTYTHYIERKIKGGPLYRYDKIFKGVITESGEEKSVVMQNHVRPMGLSFAYDMERLFQDLIDKGLMKPLPEQYGNSYIISVREMTEDWLRGIESDPFYLLDPESKTTMQKHVEAKGGRLQLSDFE